MKRLLPILAVVLLIAALAVCLPKVSVQENTDPISIDELNNMTVGVQTGVNYELILQEKYPDAKIAFYDDFSSMILSVCQGRLDSYLSESISFFIEKRENPELERIEEPLERVECNVGISKFGNGEKVYQQWEEFLTKIKNNGIYDEMLDYWFTNYDPDTCTVDKSGITGENGVLMCTAEASYEPICMVGRNGELLGYDVDMIYRFCREYGYTPQIDPMVFEAMPAALASGKYTVATGLIADEERAEEIKFTQSYMEYDIIAVYKGRDVDEGFFESVKNSFYKTFIKEDRWKMFARGAGETCLITILSVIFGSIFGLLLYLWCFHGKRIEQKTTDFLCWFIGCTPTVVLLMILYYVVFSRVLISNVIVSIVGFSLIFGCQVYEWVTSGVKAVGIGQSEAAYAQGFSKNQTFFMILFPQAAEHFLPGYKSGVVSLIQETSVVGYIAVMDLTKMSDLVRGRTYDAFFPLLVTAAIYFLIIWVITLVIERVSSATSTKSRKKEKILKKIKIN